MLADPVRVWARQTCRLLCAVLLLSVLAGGSMLPPPAHADTDLDEIARKMSNPTEPLMNVTTFIDWTKYTGDLPGAKDQNATLFLAQPPLPFPVTPTENLIIRPAIPFLFNPPVLGPNGFESAGFNLGDIAVDVLYGGTTPTGFLRGVGLLGNIPASTSPELRGEWAIGPSGLAGVIRPWGVLLLLVTQSWDVSGTVKTSRLGGQYSLAYSLPGGWQVVSSAPFTYNWDTEDLTLPLGGGPFRTVLVGEIPVKLGLQAWYYVSQPDAFGPQWQVRFQVQPSLPRPW